MKFTLYYLTIFISLKAMSQPDILTVKDNAFYNLVGNNVKIDKLSTGYGFTEGPVWHKDGYLLFSDIPGNTIYRLTPSGQSTAFRKPSENSNGLTFDREGRLIICEQKTKQIARLEKDGRVTVLAGQYEGKTFNSPNDVVMKKDGSFFFSDPPFGHEQFNADKQRQLSFTGVYFCKNDNVTLVESGLDRGNGVCLSPDESKLYVCQSEKPYIWKVYNLDKDGNVLSNKIFFQGSEITGNPDGIKVDEKGNLYCTGNNGVIIFNSEGKLLGWIKLPENPSNLAWGDADFKSLYITAATSVYRIRLKAKGYIGY